MGTAYVGLLADRDLLLNQLHALRRLRRPGDPRRRCARGFARLVELVERESGADADEVRVFFAHGMLLNVLAAMQRAGRRRALGRRSCSAPKADDCC